MINNCGLSRRFVVQLFIPLFILISVTESVAQTYTLGVKVGASLTWPAFGEKEDKEIFNGRVKPGFNAAVVVGFPLRKGYSVFIEGGASQKGRIITYYDNPKWIDDMTMQMTDMSLWLRKSYKFQLKKDTPSEWFFSIGPEINYWLNGHGNIHVEDGMKFKYDVAFGGTGEGATPENGILTLQKYNRWLFSLGVGVGLKMPVTAKKFVTVELRALSGHTFLGGNKQDDWDLQPGYLTAGGGPLNTMKTNLKTLQVSVSYTVDMVRVDRKKGKSTIKKKLKK